MKKYIMQEKEIYTHTSKKKKKKKKSLKSQTVAWEIYKIPTKTYELTISNISVFPI